MKVFDDDGTEIGELRALAGRLPEGHFYVLTVKTRLSAEQRDRIRDEFSVVLAGSTRMIVMEDMALEVGAE